MSPSRQTERLQKPALASGAEETALALS